MPKQRSTEYLLLERRRDVANLYLKGLTQWEIADELGVSQSTISTDLSKIRDEWLANALVDFEERAARELARLDSVEREAWAAWERSQLDDITRRTYTEKIRVGAHKKKDGTVIPSKYIPFKEITEETRRGQAGDSRFLEMVFKCVETRLKMLGMLKGTQVNIGVSTGVVDWNSLINSVDSVPDVIEQEITKQEVDREKSVRVLPKLVDVSDIDSDTSEVT